MLMKRRKALRKLEDIVPWKNQPSDQPTSLPCLDFWRVLKTDFNFNWSYRKYWTKIPVPVYSFPLPYGRSGNKLSYSFKETLFFSQIHSYGGKTGGGGEKQQRQRMKDFGCEEWKTKYDLYEPQNPIGL